MTTQEILIVIGLFLTYATALIGIYVNVRVKMRELEVQIMQLQKDIHECKTAIDSDFDYLDKKSIQAMREMDEKNSAEHHEIMAKIDMILERITQVRVEQARVERVKK